MPVRNAVVVIVPVARVPNAIVVIILIAAVARAVVVVIAIPIVVNAVVVEVGVIDDAGGTALPIIAVVGIVTALFVLGLVGGLDPMGLEEIDRAGGRERVVVEGPHAGRLPEVEARDAAEGLHVAVLDLDGLPAIGSVSHVRTILARDAEDAYRLFFPQDYAHYLWEVVVDAAEPLGGGPVGVDRA
jgi:hypothetical protein